MKNKKEINAGIIIIGNEVLSGRTKDIDAEYYKNYLKVKKDGVKFLAYRCKLSDKEIRIEKKIDIIDE